VVVGPASGGNCNRIRKPVLDFIRTG